MSELQRCPSDTKPGVLLLTGLLALSALIGQKGSAQSPPLLVVPGASGFGMTTRAAYGGSVSPTIYRVTNLNDSGSGSLRAAMQASEPRVVIFDTSGTIPLTTTIKVTSPYLTVAGQTAPSPGIMLKDEGIEIFSHDILIQHLSIRPGDTHVALACNNAVEMWGSSSEQYNVIFDHLSVTWPIHSNFGFSQSSRSAGVTIWRSLMAEGLIGLQATCPPGEDSYNFLVYQGTHDVAILQSIIAHADQRSPYASGGTTTYFANNLIYGFGDAATMLNDATNVPWSSTVTGNYYKASPWTLNRAAFYAITTGNFNPGSRLYSGDNALDDAGTGKMIAWADVAQVGQDPRVGTPPITLTGYVPMASSLVPAFVLANAGARPVDANPIDTRIKATITDRTGTIIGSQNDVGGWPTMAVIHRALTPPANPNVVASSGYTNLEEWLHGLAAPLEGGGRPPGSPSPPQIK